MTHIFHRNKLDNIDTKNISKITAKKVDHAEKENSK